MAIRTNYCTNPSFELDTNADGKADGWLYFAEAMTGTPVFSRVAAIGSGSYAQRVQHTGVTGDAAFYLYSSVAGLVAADIVSASILVKGSLVGCSLAARGTDQTWGAPTVVPITPSGTATRFSVTHTLAAGATEFDFILRFGGVSAGDTIDVTFDDVLTEKSAAPTAYFDGSQSFCHWGGVANASASVSSGLTVAPTQLLRPKFMPQGRVICNG